LLGWNFGEGQGCALVRDSEKLRAAFAYHPVYYHFGIEATNSSILQLRITICNINNISDCFVV